MRALRGWPLAWFLLALAFAIRLLSLGSYPLMDTTEARYGEVARKMAELGDWITPWYDVGVPFWGKPPLAFWLSAGGQLLLGANEFASRLPHWLLGVLVLWLVWDWQAREDRRQARIACVLLGSSALFFVASGAVMTDMALALALVLAMRGFWLGLHGAEGNPAPRGLADVPRPRPRAAGEGAADADPRRTADRPVGLAGVALARALAGPAMDPRKPADAPGSRALVPAGGVEDAGLPRVLPARRALAALRHRRLGRRPLRQCPRLSLRQRLAVPAGRRVSLEPLAAAAALAGLAPARGGGRWRRLAQALLAVLGTGAVPVLHLRRQRPLDLRAARPAGPGVARRRPRRARRRRAAPGCGVVGWLAWH